MSSESGVRTTSHLRGDEPGGELGRVSRSASPVRQAVRRFRRSHLAMVGVVVLALLALAAVFAPVVARHDPNTIDLGAMSDGPSLAHWLGTDQTGRDTFARIVYGGRVDLSIGVVAAGISLVIGATLGAVGGYFGGVIDSTIMRFTDVVMTFPAIVILLTVAAITGPGVLNTMLIIGLLNWPVPCRLVRAKFLSLRQQEFVVAARSMGASTPRVIFAHAFPNTIDVLVVNTTLAVANAILLSAGLSFLGLGVQPPTASWGNMVEAARNINVLEQLPWQWIPAGVAIILAVLAINFIGDGLRDALDPRMKV